MLKSEREREREKERKKEIIKERIHFIYLHIYESKYLLIVLDSYLFYVCVYTYMKFIHNFAISTIIYTQNTFINI